MSRPVDRRRGRCLRVLRGPISRGHRVLFHLAVTTRLGSPKRPTRMRCSGRSRPPRLPQAQDLGAGASLREAARRAGGTGSAQRRRPHRRAGAARPSRRGWRWRWNASAGATRRSGGGGRRSTTWGAGTHQSAAGGGMNSDGGRPRPGGAEFPVERLPPRVVGGRRCAPPAASAQRRRDAASLHHEGGGRPS